MIKDLRYPLFKPTPFSATDLAWPNKSSLSKCLNALPLARSGSSWTRTLSDSLVQSKSDSPLDSDSGVQRQTRFKPGSYLDSDSGVQRQIGLSLGLGLRSPTEIGLFLGLGLWGPRPDRTPKSAPLKSDSGLDSDPVRCLAPISLDVRHRFVYNRYIPVCE
jgi:hypothetical protein